MKNLIAFIGLVLGMTLFVFVWLCLDYFTRSL